MVLSQVRMAHTFKSAFKSEDDGASLVRSHSMRRTFTRVAARAPSGAFAQEDVECDHGGRRQDARRVTQEARRHQPPSTRAVPRLPRGRVKQPIVAHTGGAAAPALARQAAEDDGAFRDCRRQKPRGLGRGTQGRGAGEPWCCSSCRRPAPARHPAADRLLPAPLELVGSALFRETEEITEGSAARRRGARRLAAAAAAAKPINRSYFLIADGLGVRKPRRHANARVGGTPPLACLT
jgi:hypothetical protein